MFYLFNTTIKVLIKEKDDDMSKSNKIQARVLVDTTICDRKLKCGSVIEHDKDELKPYLGEGGSLDASPAAVKYAINVEKKEVIDLSQPATEAKTEAPAADDTNK